MPRKGDFRVPQDDLERAEDAFQERNEYSKGFDKALRAPITTNVEVYENVNGRGLDFPGVDTPTEDPRQGLLDAPFPDDFHDLTDPQTQTATADPVPQRIDEQSREDIERMETQGKTLINTILGP
jgi:hypothetical protein